MELTATNEYKAIETRVNDNESVNYQDEKDKINIGDPIENISDIDIIAESLIEKNNNDESTCSDDSVYSIFDREGK